VVFYQKPLESHETGEGKPIRFTIMVWERAILTKGEAHFCTCLTPNKGVRGRLLVSSSYLQLPFTLFLPVRHLQSTQPIPRLYTCQLSSSRLVILDTPFPRWKSGLLDGSVRICHNRPAAWSLVLCLGY